MASEAGGPAVGTTRLWPDIRLACSTQILSRLNLSQTEKHKEFDFGVRSRWPHRCPVVPHREKQLEQNQLEQKQLEQNSFEQKQLKQKQLEQKQLEQKFLEQKQLEQNS